jgi:6-pyruvoyltetrahydropterin/6-carboxytetrahydropterin synthase
MGLVYATRRFDFSAAHCYWRSEWSEAENRKAFGSLTTLHGHNYSLEVTVRGVPNPETGMVVDFFELNTIVGESVLSRFDHQNLNDDPAFSGGAIPTAEQLVLLIWEVLAPKIGADRLWRLRLWEDPTFYVDCYGT